MGILDRINPFRPAQAPKPSFSFAAPKGKAVVEDERKYKFRKDWGDDHPYDYKLYENAYLTVPIVQAAVDKTVDFVVGPGYYVQSPDPKLPEACEKFFDKHDFTTFLERVVRNVIVFGSAFVEVPKLPNGTPAKLKVLNPATVYVKRDEYGDVEGYAQIIKGRKVADFQPGEILHFKYNPLGDCAYGTSTLRALFGNGKQSALAQKLNIEEAIKTILDRKANAPLHVKLGSDTQPAAQADITTFAAGLEAMRDNTEWVTDHNAEIDVVGFAGKVIDQGPYLDYFERQMMFVLQVPEVMLGKGSIPEGLAQVQMEAFERRVHSMQESIERTLEDDLLNPMLKRQGFMMRGEFEWGKPPAEDYEKEIDGYAKLLQLGQLDPTTRAGIENKLRKALGIEGEVQPQALPGLVVPGFGQPGATNAPAPAPLNAPTAPLQKPALSLQKPAFPPQKATAPQKPALPREAYEFFTAIEETSVQTFAVRDQMDAFVRSYSFNEVEDARHRAATQKVFRLGIPRGWGQERLTQELAKLIADREAADRIVRTELARVENEASVQAYAESDAVDEVEWLTAEDERTCEKCAPHDRERYALTQAEGLLPFHPNCRCAWKPIVSKPR